MTHAAVGEKHSLALQSWCATPLALRMRSAASSAGLATASNAQLDRAASAAESEGLAGPLWEEDEPTAEQHSKAAEDAETTAYWRSLEAVQGPYCRCACSALNPMQGCSGPSRTSCSGLLDSANMLIERNWTAGCVAEVCMLRDAAGQAAQGPHHRRPGRGACSGCVSARWRATWWSPARRSRCWSLQMRLAPSCCASTALRCVPAWILLSMLLDLCKRLKWDSSLCSFVDWWVRVAGVGWHRWHWQTWMRCCWRLGAPLRPCRSTCLSSWSTSSAHCHQAPLLGRLCMVPHHVPPATHLCAANQAFA